MKRGLRAEPILELHLDAAVPREEAWEEDGCSHVKESKHQEP